MSHEIPQHHAVDVGIGKTRGEAVTKAVDIDVYEV
jgi:tRNA A-37 threonylcarbamoyl transferase component Bud32